MLTVDISSDIRMVILLSGVTPNHSIPHMYLPQKKAVQMQSLQFLLMLATVFAPSSSGAALKFTGYLKGN